MAHLREQRFELGFTEYFDVCALEVFRRIGVRQYITLSVVNTPKLLLGMYGLPRGLGVWPGECGSGLTV